MKLTSCIQQFFDLYHFRIKGSSPRTIKAYREALRLFLPFAANYYSIKVGSLTIEHLRLDVVLAFLDYLESDRSNAANTRNQRLAVIKSLAKMIRLVYPQKTMIADVILAIPQKKSQKKIVGFLYIEEILAVYEAVDLKKTWALETIRFFIFWLIPAPEPVKSPCSMWTTSTLPKRP